MAKIGVWRPKSMVFFMFFHENRGLRGPFLKKIGSLRAYREGFKTPLRPPKGEVLRILTSQTATLYLSVVFQISTADLSWGISEDFSCLDPVERHTEPMPLKCLALRDFPLVLDNYHTKVWQMIDLNKVSSSVREPCSFYKDITLQTSYLPCNFVFQRWIAQT